MQLEAIDSRNVASYLGEETSTCLTTTSIQVVVESNKVPPQPPLLQTKQPLVGRSNNSVGVIFCKKQESQCHHVPPKKGLCT